MSQAFPTPTELHIPFTQIGDELVRLTRENERLRFQVIDLEIARDAALANNRAGWAEAKRQDEARLALVAENERLRSSHADLYAKWFALQGDPYASRAVVAEAAVVNRERVIGELNGELADLRKELAQIYADDAVGKACPDCAFVEEPCGGESCYAGRVAR